MSASLQAVLAMGQTSAPLRRTSFTPAAGYLLDPEARNLNGIEPVLVPDSDVGPILTHPGDNEVGRWLRVAKTWAPGEGRFLRGLLRPGMNVIDVGANLGYFTALAARAVAPSGRVLAVEADPATFGLLRANVEMNDFAQVELLPVAAHRTAGLVTGTRDPDNYGGHTAYVASQAWAMVPMQAVRLDDVLDPGTPVHVIKIDIEGMDHAAVAGLEGTVRRWRPTLLVEFAPQKIAWFGDRPEDALKVYRDLGLTVAVLGEDALRLRDEAGLDLDELTRDGLVVAPTNDAEIIERTRRVGLINLVLTPRPGAVNNAGLETASQ